MDKLQDILTAFIYIINEPEILNNIESYQKDIHEKVSQYVKAQKGIACEMGCAYCCFGWEVKLTFTELFLFLKILNKLENHIKKEMAEKLENFKKGYNKNTPCPFLKNNLCSVYEARPFICRTYSSYDKKICEEKISFKFPDFIEDIIKNIVLPLEENISDEFKILFNTKISIRNINLDKEKGFFYVNIFDFVKIYTLGDEYRLEPLKLYKKFAGEQ